jgi:hypothetical protein
MIMATPEAILTRLRQLVNDDANDATLLPFCAWALEAIRSRLEFEEEIDDPRALHAAAAVAVYQRQLSLNISGAGAVSFKAGDVSVKHEGSPLKAAALLRNEALQAAAKLFRDGDFVFITA